MENFWITMMVIAALVVGLFGGAALFSTTETKIETKEVIKEVLVEVEVPGETIEVEVEVPREDFTLDTALEEFLSAVEDEEDEAGNELELLECDGDDFDFDEISVSRVYDEWSVSYDDDETTVDFEVKLKYKEDDERSCRERFEVNVHYEDGEDTEVLAEPLSA